MKKLIKMLPVFFIFMVAVSNSNWVSALEEAPIITVADARYNIDESHLEWEIWSDISSGDPLVQKMWNTSHQYTKFSRFQMWVLDCMEDYNYTKEVVAPLLLISSLKINTYFLEKYIHYEVSKYSKYHDMQRINRLYEEYVLVVKNYEIYNEAATSIVDNITSELQYKLECPSAWHCGCLSQLDVEDFKYELNALTNYYGEVKTLVIFINYVDPVLRITIVSLGLGLNVSILKILFTHKELRTESNIIIFNLLMNDIFYLILYVPLQYVHYYSYHILSHKHFSSNGVYIHIESTLFSASAFSILALYFQRYFSTSSVRKLSDKSRFAIYIATVWISASVVAIIVFLLNHYEVGGLEINSVSTMYLGLLKGLPITMFILNKLTTRKLKKMDQDRQAEIQEFISPRLTKTLCFVYWLTHTPLFMWLCIEKGVALLSLHLRFNYIYIELSLYFLLFLYPIFNSVVIFNLCSNIKKYFNLCRRRRVIENDMVGTESFQGTVDTSVM